MKSDAAVISQSQAAADAGFSKHQQKQAQRIASAEADTIEGWLAYGAALNEGRAQFHPEDDKGFGKWVDDNLLCLVDTVNGPKPVSRHDRAAAMWAAAMWAAANPDQLDAAPTP